MYRNVRADSVLGIGSWNLKAFFLNFFKETNKSVYIVETVLRTPIIRGQLKPFLPGFIARANHRSMISLIIWHV